MGGKKNEKARETFLEKKEEKREAENGGTNVPFCRMISFSNN